jgi:hypothetical protein
MKKEKQKWFRFNDVVAHKCFNAPFHSDHEKPMHISLLVDSCTSYVGCGVIEFYSSSQASLLRQTLWLFYDTLWDQIKVGNGNWSDTPLINDGIVKIFS